MSATKKNQASLDSFFRPAQPVSSQPARRTFQPPPNFPHPAFSAPRGTVTSAESTAGNRRSTSSLSSPAPSYDTYEIPISPPKAPVSNSAPTGRVVRSSDDEGSESDSSLEDLTTLLQANRSDSHPKPVTNGAPSTPTISRFRKSKAFHASPLSVQPKHLFDLKSLAGHAEEDNKAEASSKRVKAILAASENQKEAPVPPRGDDAGAEFKHHALLESVVGDGESGEMHKVSRAMKRTEATLQERRWYCFDTQVKLAKPETRPFPTEALPGNWKNDLKDPQVRKQTFISGFAEDMVSFGNTLPDEIFLWMLDEICLESSEPLRVSYCNVLKQSSEQVRRLIMPNTIRTMFEALGASSEAINIAEKIKPVRALSEPYPKRDWAKLRSFVRFLGQIAKSLEERSHVICLLLRMSVDRLVLENVDILDLVQETINRLCRYVPDDSWETSCEEICTSLFNSVDQPTLRLQIVECIPSITPRTHDLKRRLAMSFYFNDLSYSTKHSHLIMNLNKFINRLDDSDFDTNAQTDYRELAALILLLDIAVDDGRSSDLDLTDEKTEKRFDEDIEEFGATIKDIMKSIGNPGAAFISRIEAKEVMELVSQRVADTLRSRPKPKLAVFDDAPKKSEENFDRERNRMTAFLSKRKF